MIPADARAGTTVGKYKLHEIVGRGGMGVVYRGEHVYIGREVAVKILHEGYGGREDAIKRFLREARAASLINHRDLKPENVMLMPREGKRELVRQISDESGQHEVSER